MDVTADPNSPAASYTRRNPTKTSPQSAETLHRWLRLRARVRECWAMVRVARASLCVGLAAVVLMWAPQAREALIVMAEDSAGLLPSLWPFRFPPPVEPSRLTLLYF